MALAEPFLRWAGGKRWLTGALSQIFASRLRNSGTYFEPFLGSGAMFFAIKPERAVLSDLNKDLITTFREVANHPLVLLNRLKTMPTTREEYYRVREWCPKSSLDRAVRFLYLNRNCYGGLYRENRQGIFNVPFGGGERNHRFLCKNGAIPTAASVLNSPGIEFRVCDFEKTLSCAGPGDVVYCDPTYQEVTRKQFDRYGKTIFRWEDQERLASCTTKAYGRGAVVVLSNTTCNGIWDLYRGTAVVEVIRRKGLGTKGDRKTQVEYLFILDPMRKWSDWAKIGPMKRPGRANKPASFVSRGEILHPSMI